MNKRMFRLAERVLLLLAILWGIIMIAAALNAGLSHQSAFVGVFWVITGTFGFPSIVFICSVNLFFNRKMFKEGFQLYFAACFVFIVFFWLHGGVPAVVYSFLADLLVLIKMAFYFEKRKWITIKP